MTDGVKKVAGWDQKSAGEKDGWWSDQELFFNQKKQSSHEL